MADLAAFAQNGFDELTTSTNGDWVGFVPVGGSATVSATTTKGDNLTSVTISEGIFVGGTFTTIAPTSGTVLAIRR